MGKIRDDRVRDFANRKGITLDTAKKCLHPEITYNQ